MGLHPNVFDARRNCPALKTLSAARYSVATLLTRPPRYDRFGDPTLSFFCAKTPFGRFRVSELASTPNIFSFLFFMGLHPNVFDARRNCPALKTLSAARYSVATLLTRPPRYNRFGDPTISFFHAKTHFGRFRVSELASMPKIFNCLYTSCGLSPFSAF